MRFIMFLLSCLLSFSLYARTQFSPVQREAVRFLIEESQGHFDGEMFVDFLKLSKVLTKKELKRFPEVIVHPGYSYVLVNVDDCVYDVAIIVVDKEIQAVSSLYIDFDERN